MFEFMKLELRKSRPVVLGLFAGLLVSLAASAPIAALFHGAVWDAVGTVLVFWTAAGIPLAGLTLAAAAGAASREDIAAGREAALPLSARRRLFSAIGAAAVWTAILAVAVLLPGSANEQWRQSVAAYSRWRFALLGATAAIPWVSTVAVLLAAGTSAAFASGNAVFGAMIASLYCLVCGAGGLFGLRLAQLGGYEPFLNPAIAVCAAALAGSALLAWEAAPAVERQCRLKSRSWVLCAAGLLVPFLAGPFAALASRNVAEQSLHFIELKGELPRTLDGRRAQFGGALVEGAHGVLWRYVPSREAIQLLGPGQEGSDRPALAWDQRGELWLLLKSGRDGYALWTGDGNSPLVLRARFVAPEEAAFRWLGRSLGLETHKGGDGIAHALWSPLTMGELSWRPLKGYQKWQPWSEQEDIAGGGGAVYTDDYWNLRYSGGKGKPIDCRLPGPAEDAYLMMPDAASERRYFTPAPLLFLRGDGASDYLVGVRTPRGQGIAACGPDGKARLLLDGVRAPKPDFGADGSIGYRDRSGAPRALSPDGGVSAPLRVDTLENQRVLRADSGKVWVLENNLLVHVMDSRNGRELSRWRLPRSEKEATVMGDAGIAVVDAGIYALGGGRIYFVDWDGKTRDLGGG